MISLKSMLVLAVKNISRKKLRTILSVFGIVLGILLYTSMFIVTESFKIEVTNSISYLQGTILIQQKGAPTPLLSVVDRSVEYELRENLGDIVSDISPQIWFVNGSASVTQMLPIVGIFPEIDISMGGYLSLVNWGDRKPPFNNETGWVVIGETLAISLGLKIGDVLRVGRAGNVVNLTVIGIYKSGGITDMLAVASIIDIARVDPFRDLNHTVSSFLVKLKDPRYKDMFQEYMKESHPELEIIFQEEIMNRASSILSSIEKFTYLIGFLALLIGFLGVTNTIFMNVSERKKEIGILKATGWRNGEVIIEILLESFIIGFVGTIIGITLGVVAANIGVKIFAVQLRIYFNLRILLQPFSIGLLASTLAGIPPAWRAANISPIESLRE